MKIIQNFVHMHSEKIFDWMKENNFFGSLFVIQTKDLFKLNEICLIQTKFPLAK